MVEVNGRGNISAKIVADSISDQGKRITTYELNYHRYIHSEFMTHRLFSRNAASSRAIPVEKMLELVRERPAMPIHWGANQAGMQAEEECDNLIDNGRDFWNGNHYESLLEEKKSVWKQAAQYASNFAKAFSTAGYHKQIVNRLTEPFQMMKVVCTATEYDNFFYLRCHPDAQPEIQELARCMWEAREQSVPEVLKAGEWHTPYFEKGYWKPEVDYYENGIKRDDLNLDLYSLEDALKISASCCAQVSFRKADDSLDKAIAIYDRLVESKPVHASPFEHQATPLFIPEYYSDMCDAPTGTTHQDMNGDFWSGNFKGFIQHRQLIPNNACWEYNP